VTQELDSKGTGATEAIPGRIGPLAELLVDVIAKEVIDRLERQEQEAQSPPADGWLRGAKAIAAYIDAPVSRVYALSSCKPKRIPVRKEGGLIARRSELDEWIRNGGAKRP
jgi:hypothetical protein